MTLDPKVAIETALEYGVDVQSRVVFLQGEIEEEAIAIVVRGLFLLSAVDSETPITLVVSSCGGELEEAFGLHDVVRGLNCQVNTVALGKCQSAAPLLVASGTGQRFASKHCSFMLHGAQLTEVADDTPANIAVNVVATEQGMDEYARLLARYSGKRKQFWKRKFEKGTDQYFNTAQAIEWGLVDAVWT